MIKIFFLRIFPEKVLHVEYLTPGGQIINLLLAGNLLQYLYSISRNAIFYANVYIEFRFMYMFILWSVIAPHEGCKCNVTPGYVPKRNHIQHCLNIWNYHGLAGKFKIVLQFKKKIFTRWCHSILTLTKAFMWCYCDILLLSQPVIISDWLRSRWVLATCKNLYDCMDTMLLLTG